MVSTVPMLVTQHKAPAPPVTAVKPPPPRGRPSVGHLVIPYVQGLGESIKHTLHQIWNTDLI